MDILIAAVGFMKACPELDLISKYLKQTRLDISVKEFEDKKSGTVSEKKKREGALLLSAVPDGSKIVALDEKGKSLTSVGFSDYISKCRNEGVSTLCFLIGGADGHSSEVLERADLKLSLGAMTLPHFLARVVLAEQIYRAKTILDGHPYHRAG